MSCDVCTVQLTQNLNASKKNSRISSARHASSSARGLEWSSSARDRAVERSSASSRAFECEESRAISRSQARAESRSLRQAVITCTVRSTY